MFWRCLQLQALLTETNRNRETEAAGTKQVREVKQAGKPGSSNVFSFEAQNLCVAVHLSACPECPGMPEGTSGLQLD